MLSVLLSFVSKNHWQKEVRVWLTLNCSSNTGYVWKAQSQEISRCKIHNCFYTNKLLSNIKLKKLGRFRGGFVCLFVLIFVIFSEWQPMLVLR